MLSYRVTVRSDAGACRTFTDERAAGAYAVELAQRGENGLQTIAWSAGDLFEWAALVEYPDSYVREVELGNRRRAVEFNPAHGEPPEASEITRRLFPELSQEDQQCQR